MKILVVSILLWAMAGFAYADINERTHPDPGAQAKINRVVAGAYATGQPPVDHTLVQRGSQFNDGRGVNLNLSVGSVYTSRNGQAPRENNVVTRDNIVICLHCR